MGNNLFQSTLPREERRQTEEWKARADQISIHAPTRGATWRNKDGRPDKQFQSTLPREERHKNAIELAKGTISIHAPTRGATNKPITNTDGIKISIHAPTRGATEAQRRAEEAKRISIHAPTRGATLTRDTVKMIVEFQSTLPREERRNGAVKRCVPSDISIHAPTRGATQASEAISQAEE